MKYIQLSFLMIFVWGFAHAQVGDTLVLQLPGGTSQSDPISTSGPSKKPGKLDASASKIASMLEAAIMEDVFVVRQDFVAIGNEDGDEYTTRGRDYFGRSYSLGVQIGNLMISTPSLLEPWKNNVLFQQNASSYSGQRTEFGKRGLSQENEYAYEANKVESGQKGDVAVFDVGGKGEAYQIHKGTGATPGFLLVVYCDNLSSFNEKSAIRTQILYQDNIDTQSDFRFDLSDIRGDVIGGALFVPAASKGKITFALTAIVDAQQKFKLCKVNQGSIEGAVVEGGNGDDGEITKKDGKKKSKKSSRRSGRRDGRRR